MWIVISVGSILWVLATQGVIVTPIAPFFDTTKLLSLSSTAIGSLVCSTVMLVVWLFFITEAGVRSAAFTYAEMLLRACDALVQE